MEGSYSISLDEERRGKVEGTSNLFDLTLVDPSRLGEYVEHTTSEEIDDLAHPSDHAKLWNVSDRDFWA